MIPQFRESRRRNLEHGSSSSNMPLAVGDADGLSALPQEIHGKILSFLPTIDAAKAGFCCRMWRTLWYSQPKLSFDYNLFPNTERKLDTFVRFIDQTLAHHDESDVKEFELWFRPVINYESPIKKEWIIFAVQHNVQKLVLYGKIDGPKILNPVFSCQSLVKLELAVESLFLAWPETLILPNLRKLKLKYLILSDHALRQDPFSCFPALEKLSIFFCDVLYFRVLSVSASSLKTFIMGSCPGMEYCILSFQTPILSKFIYIGHNDDAAGVELNVPAHLFGLVVNGENAYVKYKSIYDLSRSVIKVTRELFKASKLRIKHWLIEYLSMAHDLPRQMADDVFSNLIFLDINILPVVEHIRTVILLLSRCPYLAEFYLAIMDSDRDTQYLPDDEDLIDFDVQGKFPSLSRITIDNFGGDDTEMMLVRLLLAHADWLDVMRIVMNRYMVLNDMTKKIFTILEYEKASEFADVIFD